MESKRMGVELLADDIAQKIKHKIQFQEYKPGDRLTVSRLCKEYGASETPVKQALNQLLGTGLVVSIPKCGMRVRTFDFQDMKNNWEARLMIEQYSAPFVIETAKHDEDFVRNLREIIRTSDEEYEKCISNYTIENFNILSVHDSNLHMSLVQCCKNDRIVEMYSDLNAHAGMFMGFKRHSPTTLGGVIHQHDEILKQILLCDTEGLKRALEQHIYSTIQIYRDTQDEI